MPVSSRARIGRTTDALASPASQHGTMNRLGSLLCPLLVGRDDLLELADRRLAEAAAGRGQFLLLAGEAGVGKSRLLTSIRRKARADGFLAVNGSISPQDQFLPAALILEMARTFQKEPETENLGRALVELQPDGAGDALMHRRRYVHDVVDQIVSAIDRPTMLDFEDIQWADEVSLEIVGELARRARDLPLLLVAAYRLEDLPPGSFFREWRARLIGQRMAEEARLLPLTRDETALMTTLILDTGLPAPREVVTAVFERTDGIPLHVEELLGALPPEAKTDGRAVRQAQVPDTIEDAILARIEQLTPDAREVARAGAVVGRCFIPAVLAGIMDRRLEDLDAPLAELQERSFLYEADPGYLDYRHQLLRDVLYRTVPAGQLRRFHARAAEFGAVLAGQSQIHASAHYERAGLRSEAYRAAVAGAEAAGRMSGRREAFELYRRAIDNMPDDLPIAEQAELWDAYSGTAAAIERNQEMAIGAERARAGYLQADRPLQAAGALIYMALVGARDGRSTAAQIGLIDQGIAELDELPATAARDELKAAMLNVRANFEISVSQLKAARRDAVAGAELAASVGGAETALESEILLARIDIVEGRYQTGLVESLRAARAAREAGHESVGITGYRNAAILAARVLDPVAARAALDEGLRYADAIQQSHCRQMMATTAALLDWGAGRWDEADDGARQELVERGCRRGAFGALDVLGFVAMGRGQYPDARHWLTESLDAGRETDEVQYILPPLWGLAETDLLAGEPRRAMDRCEEALALSQASGERSLLIPFVVTGVRAAIADRRPDDAARWLATMRSSLESWPIAGAALAHADGLVRLSAGATSTARTALESAAGGWRERGRIWEATWAEVDLASCLLRMRRYDEAADRLAGAGATATSLGSEPLSARIGELARRIRGRSIEDEPWRPLTSREFEIARHIADGKTNGEIAAELGIAPKTASSHVEHILAKLGLTRRAEIAAWTATVSAAPSSTVRDSRIARDPVLNR